ncbi:YhjR family protein [Jinshanibacter sp. LJY008]|uniref:YhjR family protein n=1 Tax=Limnobaculum eriocheiris TaxID=2897391 RepID=A0A9X1MWZ4_9GAMM|nr:cellulose biosynthesis protein BcsR [Limnobaculum eriocheiris]MCD1126429.1 YhjR family protein [Limnobaculum eriocheiris]
MNDDVTGIQWNLRQGRKAEIENQLPGQAVAKEYQNDIAAVMTAYHLTSLEYQDLSHQGVLREAFLRWPLLTEMSSESNSDKVGL